MREGANRGFGLALLASLALHALLLAALPALRELAALLPPVSAPLVARLTQAAPQPAQGAATQEARKPPMPEKPAPRPAPERPPSPPAARAAPLLPAVVAAPASAPQVAPVPQVAPAAPEQRAAGGEVPPTSAALSTASALARLEPLPLLAAPPGPDPGALDRYRLQLVTVAARFKRYPRSAIDNNWEGAVVVRMTIGADGQISALGVKSSSGHEVLDRQALEMFRTAKPFVQLPPALAGREFELELRAIYSLRDQPSG